jgi:hypothetical protein
MQTRLCLYVLVLLSISVGVCHGLDAWGSDQSYLENISACKNDNLELSKRLTDKEQE